MGGRERERVMADCVCVLRARLKYLTYGVGLFLRPRGVGGGCCLLTMLAVFLGSVLTGKKVMNGDKKNTCFVTLLGRKSGIVFYFIFVAFDPLHNQ